jgi:deoxyribose-phosphate aldolase
MDYNYLLPYIDHTLLKPDATIQQIETVAQQAQDLRVACLCIPASYVARVHAKFPQLNISGTVGFPLGYSTLATKCFEIEDAIKNGCREIDVVINIAEIKNANWRYIEDELKGFRDATGDYLLKVIIETFYLSEAEKIKMCELITEYHIDFIKTSTGFAPQGATFADIELFKDHIGPQVRMKAAGGINTIDDIVKFVELGCQRIGTSKAVELITAR